MHKCNMIHLLRTASPEGKHKDPFKEDVFPPNIRECFNLKLKVKKKEKEKKHKTKNPHKPPSHNHLP